MKPFNLEEYLKNPDRKVVTRDGSSVRIICTNRIHDYSVVALISNEDTEDLLSYTKDGEVYTTLEDDYDLFFAPESKTKKVLWMNLYKDADGDIASGDFYETKEEAFENRSTGLTYLGTSKVEWEE